MDASHGQSLKSKDCWGRLRVKKLEPVAQCYAVFASRSYAPDNMTQWYGPNGDAHTAEEIRDSSPFPELMELALRLQAADELALKRENTSGA